IDILYIILKKIPVIPNLEQIRFEINKLVELFRGFSKPPTKSIEGIWAEMLIIEQSKNPDYLVNAWHSSILSKFDFNDGIDKIEVKCTTKEKRIHRFSLFQLDPNYSSKLIIASIITSQTGLGLNIFNLRDRVFENLVDKNLIVKIDEMFSITLGKDIDKAIDYYFDYHSATDYLNYFDYNDIPKLNISEIPTQISNVKFDCDLTDIEPINKPLINSTLFESL
ncbi:MAG: PD-(D/E)XK motif protein, partial [Bacteroidota bacterium]